MLRALIDKLDKLDKLDIPAIIDAALPLHALSRVSDADCVVAMMLNVLCGREALFRMDKWLGRTDVEVLLGPGRDADAFDDSRLAAALDHIDAVGTDGLLAAVVTGYLGRPGRETTYSVHQDVTSVSLYGEYADVSPWGRRPRSGTPSDTPGTGYPSGTAGAGGTSQPPSSGVPRDGLSRSGRAVVAPIEREGPCARPPTACAPRPGTVPGRARRCRISDVRITTPASSKAHGAQRPGAGPVRRTRSWTLSSTPTATSWAGSTRATSSRRTWRGSPT